MQDRPWPKVNFEKSKKPNDVENPCYLIIMEETADIYKASKH